jgi:hypothetical protein
MAQICSFALSCALAPSAYSAVARLAALVGNRHFAMPWDGARFARTVTFVSVALMLTSFAAAQTLSGTVNNSTTGKPSAGDEVIVYSLEQGIRESSRTNTNVLGQFSFKLNNAQRPYLVRVIHQGVTYHRIAPAGTTSVAIEVYDVARKVNGIGVVADIMRIQAANGQITVTRDFGVRNTSNPPRIQLNERNLEFYIPGGAHVIKNSGTAIIENGNAVKSAPIPEGEKNRYAFVFPLRPGLTRFEVTYEIPYSGSANLDPKSIYPVEQFMVMLPKSIHFRATGRTPGFKSIHFPNAPDATVQVASNVSEKENLAFNISGEGMLKTGQPGAIQDSNQFEQSKESFSGGAGATQFSNRSGKGLGPPIDTHDQRQPYRWWILVVLAAVPLIAFVYMVWRHLSMRGAFSRHKRRSSLSTSRSTTRSTPRREEIDYGPVEAGIREAPGAFVPAPPASVLMGQIKDELFNIEVKRQSGKISEAEFEKARTALDLMLESALSAQSLNSSTKGAPERLVHTTTAQS